MAERNSPPTSQNPVVKNQPPPFEDVNLFASDCVFREAVAREGLGVLGPYPADTLFTPRVLAGADAALAMFHDQGLPVLKHAAFGQAVNVTLGLPVIRTSVDHGTALDRAGAGEIDIGSLREAIVLAFELAARSA